MRFIISISLAYLIISAIGCTSKNSNESRNDVNVLNTPCDSLETYVEMYFKRKDTITENRYGKQVIPIDTAVGNSYIEAYLREAGKDKTEGVVLDLNTIALFYDYLLKNPGMKIGISLARYDKKYWSIGRNVKDPEFDLRVTPQQVGRLAFVFGAYDSRKGFLPFSYEKHGSFYDDWNQEWP